MLADAFGCAFLAVLVPPWNRLDTGLVERLTGCGFVGLSTFGRRAGEAAPGLALINTHLDPVDWRGTRLFVGETAALTRLIAVLDAEEPIGILSHHLAMDEAGWAFLDRLLRVLADHPGARLYPVRELLDPAMTGPLLEIRDLAVDFLADEGVVQAVRGVSFTVETGQTVALVGESGSGKTVISQAILGILPQIARITRGSIILRDPRRNHEPLDLAAYDDDHPIRRSIRGAASRSSSRSR